MSSTDARPVARKNAAFRFYFAVRKNDGSLVTSWTGQDSEVSKDGGAFADCTNEATEIGSSGCGYIDLTSTEMNADAVMYKVTVTNTDALPLVVTFFPEEIGDYRCDAVQISGDTTAADNLEAYTDGTSKIPVNLVQIEGVTIEGATTGRLDVNTETIADAAITSDTISANAIGATQIATGAITSAKFAAGAINAAAIADGAIDRATFAADTGLQSVRSNTAQAGAAGSITLDASASATNDLYKYSLIYLTGGTGAGQARICSAYNGTTKVATVSVNWATNPSSDTTFAIIPLAAISSNLVLVNGDDPSEYTFKADMVAVDGGGFDSSQPQFGVNLVTVNGSNIDGKSPLQALRYIAAACAGIVSGAGTATETLLGLDGVTERLEATVDASGNRTAITYDP